MIKHVAATLTLFIILTRASIVERFDSSIDDSLFLSEQGPVDDPLDLFTDEPIAGAPPPDCHADGDTDNLFSNDIARVRTRRNSDECLPPLPPNILNLYDSTQMLNILSGDTVPETPGIDNSATDKKSSIFPDVGLDTTNEKQKKKCPDLYDGFTFPVCSSVNFRRDDLRYPKDYHWTLFNARYCGPPLPLKLDFRLTHEQPCSCRVFDCSLRDTRNILLLRANSIRGKV